MPAAPGFSKALEDKIVAAVKRNPQHGGLRTVAYAVGIPPAELHYWLRLGAISENGRFTSLARRVRTELAKYKAARFARVKRMADGFVTKKTKREPWVNPVTGEVTESRITEVVEETQYHPPAALKLYDESKDLDWDHALLDPAPGEDGVQNMAEMFARPNPEILEAIRRALLIDGSFLRESLEKDGHVFSDRRVTCEVLGVGSSESALLEGPASGGSGCERSPDADLGTQDGQD